MSNTGKSSASARWITVLGSAAVALAIFAAVTHSPSATQTAAPPPSTPTSDPNFSANDSFLTQPYIQSGGAYSQPIPQSGVQSYPTSSRFRTRGS